MTRKGHRVVSVLYCLPDGPSRILTDKDVGSEQHQLVSQGLADQHAVKGVLPLFLEKPP